MKKKQIYYSILKAGRKLYSILIKEKSRPFLDRGYKDPDDVNSIISKLLLSDGPCMVARYGAFELNTIVNYLDIKKPRHSIIKYIQNKEGQWWWNESLLSHLRDNAGFFPLSYENVERFCALMLDSSRDVDFLGSWQRNEERLIPYLGSFEKGWMQLIEPYWSNHPWSSHLKGKRVLVLHPFAELMKLQYEQKRTCLFKNPEVLPPFEFIPLIAVQSIGGENAGFKDWFEALEDMKHKMDAIEYDVALIGCGAYGFPLASHAKKTGHKAIHLAGALQLLFGIRGKRWDNPMYGAKYLFTPGTYQTLFNEHWIYPGENLKPKTAMNVEGGCYW